MSATPLSCDAANDRKALHQYHKLATADLSQVCDGRNWESFRHAANDRGRAVVGAAGHDMAEGSVAEDQPAKNVNAKTDKPNSPIKSRYKPISTRSEARQQEKDKDQQEESKHHRILPRGKILAGPDAQGTELQISRGNDPLVPSESPAAGKRKDLSRRRSSTSRGRHVENGDYHGGRRSLSGRRHSYNVADAGRLPSKGENQSRRLSIDSNTISVPGSTSGSGGPRRVTVRKLSEPMHRCAETNKSISGIMRRARYSSNDLAAMASLAPTGASGLGASDSEATQYLTDKSHNTPMAASVENDEDARTYSLFINPGKTKAAFDSISSDSSPVASRSFKEESLCNLVPNRVNVDAESTNGSTDDMGATDWVATGVDFSKSMEVYLFKT